MALRLFQLVRLKAEPGEIEELVVACQDEAGARRFAYNYHFGWTTYNHEWLEQSTCKDLGETTAKTTRIVAEFRKGRT